MYWLALLPPLWKTKDAHINWMTIGIPVRNLFSGLTVVRIGEIKISLCGKEDGGGSASYKYIDLDWVRENMVPRLLKRQLLQGTFYVESLEVDFPTALGGLIVLHTGEISVEATDKDYNPIAVLSRGRTESEKSEKKRRKKKKRRARRKRKFFLRGPTEEEADSGEEEEEEEGNSDTEDTQAKKKVFHKKIWVERLSLTIKRHESGDCCGSALRVEGVTTRMSAENISSGGMRRLVINADTVVDKAVMGIEGWTMPHLRDFGSILLQALVVMYFPPNADIMHALKALLGTEEAEVTLISDLHIREAAFECVGTESHERVFEGKIRDGRTYNIEIGSFTPNPGTVNTLTVHNVSFTLNDFKFHQELKL